MLARDLTLEQLPDCLREELQKATASETEGQKQAEAAPEVSAAAAAASSSNGVK